MQVRFAGEATVGWLDEAFVVQDENVALSLAFTGFIGSRVALALM